MICRFAQSPGYNPWYNLAFEEYLLNLVAEDEVILYLWQNDNTVVIGKHQNAWKECACRLLESEGGRLARRLSGGGAVYHDLGNLNFTFVMDRNLYNLDRQLQVLLQAVNSLGIGAEFSGRNDLVVGDRKFSGNAFCFKSKMAFHHGTLMIDTDYEKITRYLQVSGGKFASNGHEVPSVRSRVVNLASLNPDITVNAMKQGLIRSFTALYGDFTKEIDPRLAERELSVLYEKYASWEWRYGETPHFEISFDQKFIWGKIDLGLCIEDGVVKKALIYSDAMDCVLIEELSAALQDIPFKKGAMVTAAAGIGSDAVTKDHIADLIRWFDSLSI
jgi:lipoate-protein ligase A